jgi:hypothetical protein
MGKMKVKLSTLVVVSIVLSSDAECASFAGNNRAGCMDFLVDNRTEDSFKISAITQNSGIIVSDQDYSSDIFERYEISGKERKRYFAKLTDGTYAPQADKEDYLLFENDKLRFMMAFTLEDKTLFVELRSDMAPVTEEGYNFCYIGYGGFAYGAGMLEFKLVCGGYRIVDCFKRHDGKRNIVIENQTDDDSWMKEISPYGDMPWPSESWWSRFCCCAG